MNLSTVLEVSPVASAISDLDSIVDHYGQGNRVNLIGHSWGAMLVSAYLGQYPEKVDHAVLAEPGFLTSDFAGRWSTVIFRMSSIHNG